MISKIFSLLRCSVASCTFASLTTSKICFNQKVWLEGNSLWPACLSMTRIVLDCWHEAVTWAWDSTVCQWLCQHCSVAAKSIGVVTCILFVDIAGYHLVALHAEESQPQHVWMTSSWVETEVSLHEAQLDDIRQYLQSHACGWMCINCCLKAGGWRSLT